MGVIVLDSFAGVLFIKVFIGVLSIVGVLGNALVVLSVVKHRSMHTVMHYLLVNLGIADTLVAVFLLMRYVFADIMAYPSDVRAGIICKFVSFGTISWVGLHAQVFTLIVISFERYSAVIHPHNSRRRLTKKKLKVVLVLCWVYAIGFIMPDFIAIRYDQKQASCIYQWSDTIQKTWAFLWFFTCGPIPLVSMGIMYGKVVYDLWIKKAGRVSESRKAVIQSRKRVTKVVITVTIIYGICWLPNLTMWLTGNFITIPHLGFLINLTHVLLLFNSSVNPFVYGIQSQHFRKCMIRTLHFWKPRNSVVSEVQDTRTNTNTGSMNAFGGAKSRDHNCQSSHVVLEGRVPSGIIQEPHHLETKKRFSLVKADCHANTVHPINTVVVKEAGCNSNVGYEDNELLTIESTEHKTVGQEYKTKDFSVFQVDVGEVESGAGTPKVKFEQKHLTVDMEEGDENKDYGGVWMGSAEGEDNNEMFPRPSTSQTTEEKDSKEKKIQSAFIKVKAFAGFAHAGTTDDMKKEQNNSAGLYPSFLDDLKTKQKQNNPKGEEVSKGDNINEKEQCHRDNSKQHPETFEENTETGNQSHSGKDADTVSEKTEGNDENNDKNKSINTIIKDSNSIENASSSTRRKSKKGSKQIGVFSKLADDTELEGKKLVLPRITRAGTPLVMVKHYTRNEDENTTFGREKTFDKKTWLQEKEKMKLLRSLRDLDITK